MSVRDLRNHSADVLRRVERGEHLTVTKDGDPVAEVVPLRRRPVRVEELIARRAALPVIDADLLRSEIDDLLDPAL